MSRSVQLPDPYPVALAPGPVQGAPNLPGSKSITNRALIIAALADGVSTLRNALFCDDTEVMIGALRALGIGLTTDPSSQTIVIHGCAGEIPVSRADLFVGNSGTTARFLTAALALGHGQYHLDGTERMRQRPIGPLLDTLRELGVEIRSERGNGYPPVLLSANGLHGGETSIRADVSSQFLSGLLLAAPYAQSPLRLHTAGSVSSEPYIRMTEAMQRAWGIHISCHETPDGYTFDIAAPQKYRAREYFVEPDASASSYFMAAAVVTGGRVRINGLGAQSLQGDAAFAAVLQQCGGKVTWEEDAVIVEGAGPLHGIDIDMNPISDTVLTLAAIAPLFTSPTHIRNVEHIRYKECDRISCLVTELRRLEVVVEEHTDGLTVYPGPVTGAAVDTYDDHRMAMSFSILGLRVPNLAIRNPSCVNKTFPTFFQELSRMCGVSGSQSVVRE